ncbi:MAG: histidine kinase [Acidobacteria bacterium]|nr:histidine kinase [Acidobacteriota bacterium]
MLPLLSGRRLIFYFAAWLPVSGLLTMFYQQAGQMPWWAAGVLAILLSIVFAMICLSAWYLCRWMPVSEQHIVRSLAGPGVTAAVAAAIWVLASRAIAAMLASTTAWELLEEKTARGETWLWASGVLLYLLSMSMGYLMLEVEAARASRLREAEALTMAREAELRALRQQVNPHFLFNSLNSISALVGMDKAKAREMCALLADFLRLSLGVGDRRFIPLREELGLIRRYLAIEQVRFGERLRFEEQVADAALSVAVPPLLLQPLVENAVKHGVAQSIHGGLIRLEAETTEGELTVAVVNTFEQDEGSSVRPKGAGVGLANIEKRLATLYGDTARLHARTDGEMFRAEIRLLREAVKS